MFLAAPELRGCFYRYPIQGAEIVTGAFPVPFAWSGDLIAISQRYFQKGMAITWE